MLRTSVNTTLGAQITNPGTTLFVPLFSRHLPRHILTFLLLAMILLISTSYVQSPKILNKSGLEFFTPASADSLREYLSDLSVSETPVVHGDESRVFDNVRKFYQLNDYKPVWTHSRGVSKRASQLLGLIEHAREYGLEPAHYHLAAIQELNQQLGLQIPEGVRYLLGAEFEILMTDAAISLMTNLHKGYTPFDTTLYLRDWYVQLPTVLLQGFKQENIRGKILSLQPEFVEYVQLQQATEKFIRSGQLTDQWTEFSYPVKDTVALRRSVKKVLIALGYLGKNSHESDFDKALMQFQYYHGLEPDGRCGMNTLDALGQSTLFKYRKLALNLDRLRKLDIQEPTSLYVNIPSYQLRIFKENNCVDTFRVIVGQPASPTPLLEGVMKTIIANPVWYVPKSITMNEILPKIKSDTGYLKRNGFRILDGNYRTVSETSINMAEVSPENFNYTIRQNRGSDNSLGQVKFVFTNPYSVYLHDTPSKSLFSKDIRAFSHGCIRVEHPEMLAEYIIHEINGEKTDITDMIRKGRHYEIDITASLPIYIRYITCEADKDGNLFFYKDIYGYDRKELEKFILQMGV